MTDDEAIAYALQILARRASATAAPTLTLAELYARYEAANQSRASWPTIMFRLRPVVAALGARDVMSMRVADWTAYRTPREARWAPKTLNMELAWLKAVLRWGVVQGLLLHEPQICQAVKVKHRKHRETAPDERDIGALLDEAIPRERVIVLCAADAGMRRNEIRQLQWSWVGSGEIAIPDWAAKGGRGGVVPLTSRLAAAIDAMPVVLRSSYVLANPRTGGPYSKGRFCEWFLRLQERAGLVAAPLDRRVHLHDLRHGFATNAVERGVGIEAVSDFMRHATLEQTRDYVQRRPRDLARARELFEAGIERDRKRR